MRGSSPTASVPARNEAPSLELTQIERSLVVRLPVTSRIASWAIVGGGLGVTQHVVWCQVTEEDVAPPSDPCALARARIAELGLQDAVAFLTSRRISARIESNRTAEGMTVCCVATVGLHNSLRAGDPPGDEGHAGTINLLCWCSEPLSDLALIEGLAIAAEARAAVMMESPVKSQRSGRAATGTGTDCVAVAAPAAGTPLPYAGKHTLPGHLIGSAVEDAMRRGVDGWLADVAAFHRGERW